MAHFERILHPTDFSENGRAALPLLADVCAMCPIEDGPTVHVVHVLEPIISTTDFTWSGLSHNELEAKRLEAAQEALREFVDGLGLRARDVVTEVLRGKSHEAIDQYAERHDIDLIVMATHGHRGLSHLLLGSTAELVVRTARCPVLTVKGSAPDAD